MRSPLLSALFLAATLLASYGALRACAARPSRPRSVEESGGGRPAEVEILRGTLELAGGRRSEVSVAPLHVAPELEAFRARTLGALLGLGAGEPFLMRVAEPDGAVLDGARVLDAGGEAIVPLGERLASGAAPASGRAEPWRALVARASAAGTELGWGRFPGEGARLELSAQGGPPGVPRSVALARVRVPAKEVAEWTARATPEPGAEVSGADARVAALEAELEAERARRQASETALVEYQRIVGRLEAGGAREIAGRPAPHPPAPAVEPVDPATAAARARAQEIQRSLSALLKLEGMRGLDLFEAGTLGAGHVGPVTFRLLDDRGRLIGGLVAERLRLEASRSARTVTLVLEDGAETAGERRTPFNGGTRRIPLVQVDPGPWFEAMPELFAADVLDPPNDDGLWDHARLRIDLNRLLGLDGSAGFFRLHSFDGVLGDELVGVHLEEFDGKGALVRRYFADRLRIALDPPGISLMLRDGAIVVGDAKEPFRDGRHRIYLPRVPLEDWRAAHLPGLSRAVVGGAAGETPRPRSSQQ